MDAVIIRRSSPRVPSGNASRYVSDRVRRLAAVRQHAVVVLGDGTSRAGRLAGTGRRRGVHNAHVLGLRRHRAPAAAHVVRALVVGLHVPGVAVRGRRRVRGPVHQVLVIVDGRLGDDLVMGRLAVARAVRAAAAVTLERAHGRQDQRQQRRHQRLARHGGQRHETNGRQRAGRPQGRVVHPVLFAPTCHR